MVPLVWRKYSQEAVWVVILFFFAPGKVVTPFSSFRIDRIFVRGLRAVIAILCFLAIITLGYLVLIVQPMQRQLHFQTMHMPDGFQYPAGNVTVQVSLVSLAAIRTLVLIQLWRRLWEREFQGYCNPQIYLIWILRGDLNHNMVCLECFFIIEG
jgi:hypothetical protein